MLGLIVLGWSGRAGSGCAGLIWDGLVVLGWFGCAGLVWLCWVGLVLVVLDWSREELCS